MGESERTLSLLIGVLTGHCTLGKHLWLLGVEEDPTRFKFGKGDETFFHFFGECKGYEYERLRFKTFQVLSLQMEELRSLGWNDILTSIGE